MTDENQEIVAYLAADEIREIDQIRYDEMGTDHALRVALNYAANRVNELYEKRQKWWDRMARMYGLDLDRYLYRVRNINNSMAIVRERHKREEDDP